MLVRNPALRNKPGNLLKAGTSAPTPSTSSSKPSRRNLHTRIIPPPPPQPTPFVPDASTFLTLIGRKLSQHASKIPSWSALFNLTSTQLKDLGIDPPRNRKYLLRWREKFRRGDWGIGGDFKYVTDGVARVRAVDVPRSEIGEGQGGSSMATATMTRSAGQRRVILNVPVDKEESAELDAAELARQLQMGTLKPVFGLHIKGTNQVYGPHVEAVKGTGGSVAIIKVKEGLWEHRRGHKIDGGERRKAEVRSKRRAAERKAARS